MDSDSDLPVIRDSASVPLLPTPSRVDLKTIDDVRLEMARVYREMRTGQIDTQDGTRLSFVLGQIGKLIQVNEIEQRMVALEKVLKQRRLSR